MKKENYGESMPGTEKSGRPGGNPDLKAHQFEKQYDWDEPCTALISVRVPPNIKEKLKKLPNWQERVRKAIAKQLAEGENAAELEKAPEAEGE